MHKVLLAEDDLLLGEMIAHSVAPLAALTVSPSLKDLSHQLLNKRFDALLLDEGLPDGSALRWFDIQTKLGVELPPLIFISGKDDESFVSTCLSKPQVRDYILKPFHPNELIAKLRRLLKAPTLIQASSLVNSITTNPLQRSLRRNGKHTYLSPIEFYIWKELAEGAESLTRSDLQQKLWPLSLQSSRNIEVHICNLRRKLHDIDLNVVLHGTKKTYTLECLALKATPNNKVK